MEPEIRRLRDVSAAASAAASGDAAREIASIEEIDTLEALAEFEVEHRRILAMQTLYYKRRKAGGVA